MNVRQLGNIQTVLGEGPYWDATEGVLYFIDVRASQIHRYDPSNQSVGTWATPVQPAAISRTADQRLIAALGDGFYEFDPLRGTFTLIVKVEFDHESETLNDGKVDRQGRFVAGSTNNGSGQPVASVYSFDGEKISKLDTGFSNCNGPCWSPDGTTFYLADTGPNVIYAYDYDVLTGNLANKRVFSDTSEVNGMPDGATVDARGRVWWTFVMGDGELMCYNPDGTINQRHSTGIRWMSSIQIGGSNMDTVYLTSLDPAANGIDEIDPRPGALFSIEGLDVIGSPEPFAVTPAVSAQKS